MTEVNYKPLNKGVLIELVEKTASGIFLPENSQTDVDHDFYTLVATADDCVHVKTGDKVNFAGHANPTKIEVQGKTYLLAKEHEILGKLITTEVCP
jgi:co-chaperonin GroES (HSP10)